MTDTDVAVRRLFDAKAAAWPVKYGPGGRLAGRLAQLAGAVTSQVPAGAVVLDLGCGTGELASALAAAGIRAVGCDLSPQMLRSAACARRPDMAGPGPGARGPAAAGEPGGTWWVQLGPGWRTLPLQPGSFDAVVAASVLEYVADPDAVLGECRRVLRPGGIMLCTVPDPFHPVRWLEWLLAIPARLLPLPAPALVPPAASSARPWSRLRGYLTYLRLSRHRHSLHWWRAAARQAGLSPPAPKGRGAGWPAAPKGRVRRPGGATSPLRLITFVRPADDVPRPAREVMAGDG
jgi:SAM-dependent methyltransferase